MRLFSPQLLTTEGQETVYGV